MYVFSVRHFSFYHDAERKNVWKIATNFYDRRNVQDHYRAAHPLV